MKTKAFRLLAVTLAVLVVLSACALFGAGAVLTRRAADYTNPETEYQVMIIDELGLLSAEEKAALTEEMSPVTEYGHAIFWTTEEYTYDEINQARLKRKELYSFDSACVFAINMNVRKLTIQSYGTIYDYVNDSKARSITDNVSHYATSRDYYTCAKTAFGQIYQVVNGEKISEPMKYISYAVIAMMLGVIIALCLAFSKRFNPLRRDYPRAKVTGSVNILGQLNAALARTERIYVSSGSSGGGGSSCGGGGCGGGSSCGGGGGCGGGGSSSF